MNGWHALAARQYGVITRAQPRAEGLSNRQVDAQIGKTLERMHSGVLRVAGSYPSARQKAMAACLWCGPDALLSHATAAGLFRLPVAPAEVLHVTVPPLVKRQGDLVTVHRSDIETRDRYQVDGLPVTSPTRTIIDLAATLDGEELENTFETARRMCLITKTVLERRASERRVPAALRDVLRVADARPKESKLEVKAARLLRGHGLRPDAAQHRVEGFRIDFVWLRSFSASSATASTGTATGWHGSATVAGSRGSRISGGGSCTSLGTM